MKDGNYEFYTIQHKMVASGEVGKAITPTTNGAAKWEFANWDFFNVNPTQFHGKGYVFPGGNEPHEVLALTGCRGYWSKEHAEQAIKRLEDGSLIGEYDARDSYGRRTRVQRFQFRLVKMTKSQTTEVVE